MRIDTDFLTPQSRLDLYTKMYRVRKAEDLIIKHYSEDQMKTPMHMSRGQEAVAVAVCHALGMDTQIFGTYRSHALFLAQTGDTDGFFGELYGKVTGTAHGKGGSMHLAAPKHGLITSSAIVATPIPLAVGAAFANKQRRNASVACAYFGDGALEEGVFWESMNVACVMALPVLFVCEDNGFAVDTKPEARQGYRSITSLVDQFEANVFSHYSTDVEALYRESSKAIQAIHKTGKPSFLHLKCYRYLGHVGIEEDFEYGFRGRSEYEDWLKRDPIGLQRNRLLNCGWTNNQIVKEEKVVDHQLEQSITRAQNAPAAPAAELYLGVFNETIA